jgi:predicted pyridoxine 5'-phosphate oxidase superfamily flavin-nucleotide-binding protein
MITPEIRDFLNLQKLAYVATVTSDGKPNISPKGTVIGWNAETLAFADIRSPNTMKNLRVNPHIEINVIDPLLRKGYLFEGTTRMIYDGSLFEEIISHYRTNGIKSPINSIVLVDVTRISDVTSPLYDLGISEDEIKSKWQKHFANL